MSPTQRTRAELKKLGYTSQIVEVWNSFVRRRIDLFGFIDILAVKDSNTLAIQTCSGGDHAARRAKILAHPNLPPCLKAGWIVEVWSWDKKGARGERKLWTCRKEAIVLADLDMGK